MKSKKGLNKRGFAVQFNWLFVLIGGAVILGFFISVIVNYIYDQEIQQKTLSIDELDQMLKVDLSAADTEKTRFFQHKILFSCDEISEYVVEGALKGRRYDYTAIFSPTELEPGNLVIMTTSFEAPYRVMPLVYVTSKDIEYVFAGTSTIINLVYNSMPTNTTKKFISTSISNYLNNNYDHTVFVVGDNADLTPLNDFNGFEDRVYGVVITPGMGSSFEYGSLSFYHYEPAGFVYDGTLPFLKPELALGGVISHDNESYKCNLKKVLKRIELLSELYKNRAEYYAKKVPSYCRSHYTGPVTSAEIYLTSIQTYAQEEVSLDNFKNLMLAVNELRSLNEHVLRGTECPIIY